MWLIWCDWTGLDWIGGHTYLPTYLSDRALMAVSREKRTAELRTMLVDLNGRYLPSNVVYLPVGNACHRVWAIHAMESFAFSTKERVPCLICFEVM